MNPNAAKASIIFAFFCSAGGVFCAEQQASFAVAITLHAISKPLAASQLCPAAKPLDRAGVAISITCPQLGDAPPSSGEGAVPGSSRSAMDSFPTVVVSF